MSTLAKMMLMRGGSGDMGSRDTGAGSVTGGGSGNRNEMRGGRMEGGRMEYGEMRYEGDTEMARRRRYSNGRYAPRNEMQNRIGFEMGGDEEPEMRYPMWPPMYESRMGGHGGEKSQKRGHGSGMRYMPMDRKLSDRWVEAMQEESGKELWPREITKQIAKKNGMEFLDENEFFAVFNAMYTDFCEVAKKWDVDKPDFYADLAEAFIEDDDAVDEKIAAYYACVVKHE